MQGGIAPPSVDYSVPFVVATAELPRKTALISDLFFACFLLPSVHVLVTCIFSMSTQPDLVGGTRRCLNLGSYNYLGFAAADEYCTPRVLDSLADWGVSTCSSRTEAGEAGWLVGFGCLGA